MQIDISKANGRNMMDYFQASIQICDYQKDSEIDILNIISANPYIETNENTKILPINNNKL
jgi:hypothetical protein